MAVPVYLVHWNAPDWVRSATDSLLRSDISVKVSVIDNGPAEATAELRLDDRVRLIAAGSNGGYSAGANLGLADWMAGTEPFCVVGSHDLHVEPSTVRCLIEAMEREPKAGVLGPKFPDALEAPVQRVQSGIEVRPVHGGCLLLRRECIAEVGGFNEAFGSYGEDEELCWRVDRAGWLVGCVPDVLASDLGTRTSRRNFLSYPNQILLLRTTRGWSGVPAGLASHARRLLLSVRRQDWSEVAARWAGLTKGIVKALRPSSPRRFS